MDCFLPRLATSLPPPPSGFLALNSITIARSQMRKPRCGETTQPAQGHSVSARAETKSSTPSLVHLGPCISMIIFTGQETTEVHQAAV